MNTQDYYLLKIIEEASEVQQIVSKCMRFGLEDYHPKRENISNVELLIDEILDLYAVLEICVEEEILPEKINLDVEKAIKEKKEKIQKYLQVSKDLGMITDEIRPDQSVE